MLQSTLYSTVSIHVLPAYSLYILLVIKIWWGRRNLFQKINILFCMFCMLWLRFISELTERSGTASAVYQLLHNIHIHTHALFQKTIISEISTFTEYLRVA